MCLQVSSAFSQMLNLHNLSEDISNAQSERAARMGEVYVFVALCCIASLNNRETFIIVYLWIIKIAHSGGNVYAIYK